MNETLLFTLIGALGGFIRAAVGARKALLENREFVWSYFVITVFIAAGIGAAMGAIIGGNKVIALTVGYAGTDLLEGLAKSVKIVPTKIG